MNTRRSRHARRLSGILTRASGVHTECRYDFVGHRYAVHWTGGPTTSEMIDLAAKHADEVPLLDLADFAWLRTEPASDPRSRYDYGT